VLLTRGRCFPQRKEAPVSPRTEASMWTLLNLMGVQLPSLGGYQVTHQIKQTARAAGCDCYVPKFFSPATAGENWQFPTIAAVSIAAVHEFNGHPNALSRCPLLGVKRTSTGANPMSAFDPKRTCQSKS
jgi:hypothetical protein